MNALLQAKRDPQRERFEADLTARLEALFEQCPELCGFAVDEAGMIASQLTCHPERGHEQAEALLGEIANMLLEFFEERPEAAELLRGRTFARTLH